MAHFSKIDENNIVVKVVVVSDSDANNDADGSPASGVIANDKIAPTPISIKVPVISKPMMTR